MTEQHIDKEAFNTAILGFFDQRILAVYKSEPDKYILETDNFEGTLQTIDDNKERRKLRICSHCVSSGWEKDTSTMF